MSRPARVLILDDDPGSALLQARSLERAGYRALTAETAEAASNLLAKSPVDVITVDYRLQGETTGLGFCARLRASGSRIPMILVSGSSDDRTIVQALRMGIQDYIPKDHNFLDRLPTAVASVIGRAELERQLAAGVADTAANLESGIVLILENDPIAARQESRDLKRAGYDVKIAGTPADALRILQQHPVGLLLIDQRLENERSGLEVYDQFRSSGFDLPAVLVTAYSDAATAAAALRAGIREYVEKAPGYTTELPKVVQRVFDRVHLERQAAESNARLAAIVSSATDAILTVEVTGLITLFNHAAESTFVCSAADALETSITRFVPGLFRASPDGTIQAEETSHLETQGLRKDGSVVPLEVSIAAVEISGRKFYTVIARDITARKETESAVLRANEELRKLNADLEEFAYSTSHDLKEPLRNIAIYTQMLRRQFAKELQPDAGIYLSRILEGAGRMETLLTDLLAYTQVLKADSRERAEPPLADGASVLARVLDDLASLLRETDSIVTAGNLPRVPVLEIHLSQLFQNLISNAVKYRSKEPPRVHISAARQHDDWLFSVRDNGIGIEPQFQERIFGLFKRLHSRDRYPGSGIGLAICKRIVERYGGRIWVESQPGAGSTFFFTLRATGSPTGGGE